MKRLKILISAYACNPSASLQLHPGEDLTGWKLTEQVARKHETWVVTHEYNRVGIEAAGNRHTEASPRFVFVKLPKYLDWLYKFGAGERLYYYFWQIAAWRVARRLHREFRFDLAHHLTFGNYWMPSFIGAFLSVPFVWGPVGGGQKTPPSLLSLYNLLGQFSEIGRDLAQWLGRNILVSRRLCLRRSNAILVCNAETRLQFPEKYRSRVSYFPVNGISKEDLAASARRKSGKKFRILTAGRLIRLKGFNICIEAFARFVKEFPDSTLEIVGQGPEEDRLRKLAFGLDVSNKLLFVPWLDRRNLLKKMRESDVFLFASFRDGGGAVVMEAMASGLPVVCLNSGGPGFHVREGWGIRIQPRKGKQVVEDIAEALTRLRLHPMLKRKMGEAGRKRAKECYLWEKLGLRLEEIYRKAIQAKSLT